MNLFKKATGVVEAEQVDQLWRDLARHFPYAAQDPEPGEALPPPDMLTPSMVARELKRRTGRAGWGVKLVVVRGHGGKFWITPPYEPRLPGIAIRQLDG